MGTKRTESEPDAPTVVASSNPTSSAPVTVVVTSVTPKPYGLIFAHACVGWVLGLGAAMLVASALESAQTLAAYVLGGGLSLLGFILGGVWSARR